MVCKLDTLFDIGNPISFMKDMHVLINLVISALSIDSKYIRLNNSILKAKKGRITVKIALNNKEPKFVSLIVIPASSMRAAVVIGRDVL
jgi:hypothetical protein